MGSAFNGDGGTESEIPQALTVQVIEVEENRKCVTQAIESSSGIKTVLDSFCHRAMRLFEGAGLGHSKSMKRGFYLLIWVLDW